MQAHYKSKIEAAAAKRAPPGSFGDLGPGALAVGEWTALGLELPDLVAMRAYRLARVRAQQAARDYAGIVVTDPINIRYATDSANMQVWCTTPCATRSSRRMARSYCSISTDAPISPAISI